MLCFRVVGETFEMLTVINLLPFAAGSLVDCHNDGCPTSLIRILYSGYQVHARSAE